MTDNNKYGPLVTVDWLHHHINDNDLIVLDASQEKVQSNQEAESKNIRIPGARFFDLKNDFSDPNSQFPHTFPSENQFETNCRKLGINSSSTIIVYDNLGIYTSPRVWWMFRAMGHIEVYVLDGGLPEWIKSGYATEPNTPNNYNEGNFRATLNHKSIYNINDITNNIESREKLVVDARSKGRFEGTSPEPREGLKSGHIPNSINIPFTEVLDENKYKSVNQLKELFENQIQTDQSLIFSCGSGVTACIVLLAAELILIHAKGVYDGSWTEWATVNQ